MKFLRWIIAIVVAAVVLVVGGTFVYIHFIEPDPAPRLTLSPVTTTTGRAGATAASSALVPLTGTWKIASGTTVGYRVHEVLFGQSNEATGRTTSVTGQLTINGTTVDKAGFTVDMTTVSSDESQRDDQFQNRIMDTADFPTATFTLTKPIAFGTAPAIGTHISQPATGNLTLHGTTKSVTFTVQAQRRDGRTIEVQGDIPVTFSDYNIDNPSGGPASVGNSGTLEFLLELDPS